MMFDALFHIVNTAGGLNMDPLTWRQVMALTHERPRPAPEAPPLQSLADAAEQLRRLGRYGDLQGTPARLLENALAIVERESGRRTAPCSAS